jgi:toxin ParE1/3/4
MASLFVTRRAEDELRDIWRYIAADSPDAADRLLLRIGERLDRLRDFPNIGTLRDDIRPGFRMLVEGNYLLLYDYDQANDEVELVSVIDGRRDLSEMF